jgi:hypothetical protein
MLNKTLRYIAVVIMFTAFVNSNRIYSQRANYFKLGIQFKFLESMPVVLLTEYSLSKKVDLSLATSYIDKKLNDFLITGDIDLYGQNITSTSYFPDEIGNLTFIQNAFSIKPGIRYKINKVKRFTTSQFAINLPMTFGENNLNISLQDPLIGVYKTTLKEPINYFAAELEYSMNGNLSKHFGTRFSIFSGVKINYVKPFSKINIEGNLSNNTLGMGLGERFYFNASVTLFYCIGKL